MLVYAPNGELRAAVEVKAVSARPPEWIARFLSNLLEFDVILARVPYFLLAVASVDTLPDELALAVGRAWVAGYRAGRADEVGAR